MNINTEKEINLTQTFDARIWASEWIKAIAANPSIPTDEGCMIGWFANAIMAGHDEAVRRLRDNRDSAPPAT